MFRQILFAALMDIVSKNVQTGAVGNTVNKMLQDFINKYVLHTQQLTVNSNDIFGPFKDALMQAIVAALKQAITNGQLTDILVKILNGILGSANGTAVKLPIASSQVVDVTTDGNQLFFHHDNGSVIAISF